MPVVNAVLVPAFQARKNFLLSLAVPHFDGVGVDVHFHPLADQPGRHRVEVPLDVDRAPRLHPHPQLPERFQPTRRQRIQILAFVVECFLLRGVAAFAHLAQEDHVRFRAREIVAAAQEQRLLHGTFEAMMALLDVAVLVPLARVDRLRFHPVVRHHRLITAREKLRSRSLHRQTHAIRAMLGRHSAQCPHRVLKAFAEARETLREAERHVLPVRVRQHEVVDQVRERLAVDRHAQFGQVREVGGAEPAGRMVLREENLLVRPARGLPVFDPALQRAQLAIIELLRMTPLQFLEERLGFPARRRFEQFFDFAPDLAERIVPRPMRSRRRLLCPLRGQPIRVPNLPCRLAIHARLRRRKTQRRLLAKPLPQRPNLSIRDHHRATPSRRRSAPV